MGSIIRVLRCRLSSSCFQVVLDVLSVLCREIGGYSNFPVCFYDFLVVISKNHTYYSRNKVPLRCNGLTRIAAPYSYPRSWCHIVLLLQRVQLTTFFTIRSRRTACLSACGFSIMSVGMYVWPSERVRQDCWISWLLVESWARDDERVSPTFLSGARTRRMLQLFNLYLTHRSEP